MEVSLIGLGFVAALLTLVLVCAQLIRSDSPPGWLRNLGIIVMLFAIGMAVFLVLKL